MSISYNNLSQTQSFSRLTSLKKYDYTQFSVDRISKYNARGAGYAYNYAAKSIDDDILSCLFDLAKEQEVLEKYRSLATGEIMNTGERRMVLHHALRGTLIDDVVKDGRNYQEFYLSQRNRIKEFAQKVHDGTILGSTGKQFKHFVQIGIGGSDLGPRALYLAMQQYVYTKEPSHPRYDVRFISNVDPDDLATQLQGLDQEATLFVLVSKSGTTQETLTNEMFAIQWLESKNASIVAKKHIVAVTSETSPLAKSPDYLDSFFIDDYIGGRYSVTSAVGVCIFDLGLGSQYTDELLKGAHAADKSALESDLSKNPILIDALIGVYERNICHYPYTAVLPYSQALHRFAAHLQQLDMESNGKQVNRDGGTLDYATGPVIFGEPGTNGQHSFYQLLHQGTDIIPLQFISFGASQIGYDINFENSTSQEKLQANLAAQIVAFALGKDDENPHKQFKGKRPSSVLYAPTLTPEILGSILAHFENKVMFQGFIWNINSFDQEGVQLGKLLTNEILKGSPSDVLSHYYKMLK